MNEPSRLIVVFKIRGERVRDAPDGVHAMKTLGIEKFKTLAAPGETKNEPGSRPPTGPSSCPARPQRLHRRRRLCRRADELRRYRRQGQTFTLQAPAPAQSPPRRMNREPVSESG